jgi:hypothetical protein
MILWLASCLDGTVLRSTDSSEQGGRKREAHKSNRYILDVVSLMDKEGRQLKVIGLKESSYKKGGDKSVNTGVLMTVLTTICIRKLVTSTI